jgi:hypothetical protein
MPYQIRVVSYREADVDPANLMSIKDAAAELEMTMQGVIAAINRGELTEIVKENAPSPFRDRRFVLREEVATAKAKREESDLDAPMP